MNEQGSDNVEKLIGLLEGSIKHSQSVTDRLLGIVEGSLANAKREGEKSKMTHEHEPAVDLEEDRSLADRALLDGVQTGLFRAAVETMRDGAASVIADAIAAQSRGSKKAKEGVRSMVAEGLSSDLGRAVVGIFLGELVRSGVVPFVPAAKRADVANELRDGSVATVAKYGMRTFIAPLAASAGASFSGFVNGASGSSFVGAEPATVPFVPPAPAPAPAPAPPAESVWQGVLPKST